MSVEAIHNRLDALTPGGLVGRYLLLTPLGVGGSGWVWAAAREARLGAELRHANIRTVYELNEQDGLP